MLPQSRILMLPLLAALGMFPRTASAQTGTAPHDRKPVPSRQADLDARMDKGLMLDTDPRLKQKVTLRADNVALPKVLGQLSDTAHVSLIAVADSLQGKKLTVAFVDKPLRDVLDALSALGDYEWVGRKTGTFVLRAAPPKPVDAEQEALFKWGKDLRGAFAGLTPEQKQALSVPYGTPLSALPADMQSAMQGALSTLAENEPVGPDGVPLTTYEDMLNNQGSLMVGFDGEPMGGGTDYYFSIAMPGKGGGTFLVGHGD